MAIRYIDPVPGTPPAKSKIRYLDEQSIPEAAMEMGGGLGRAVTQPYRDPEGFMKASADSLPALGAAGGTLLQPAGGGAVGAGVGTLAKQGIKTLLEGRQYTPREAASEAMLQTAVAGVPEVGGVQKALQATAQNFGSRALGFMKGTRKRLGAEKIREVSQEMLDQGVIKPFSGAPATLSRAEDVAETAGRSIGEGMDALDQAGIQSFNTQEVARKAYLALKPSYSGGEYEAAHRIAEKVRDTILAHGKGPISFKSAQALKETLQDIGKFESSTNALKAQMFRKGSSVVRQALEDAVDAAGKTAWTSAEAPAASAAAESTALAARTQAIGKYKPKTKLGPYRGKTIPGEEMPVQTAQMDPGMYAKYLKDKKVYGAAETAKAGLEGRVAAEASNMPISLPGIITGAAHLGAGNPLGALASVGALEGAKRRGSSTMAALINAINNQAAPVRTVLLSRLVSLLSGRETIERVR